MQLYLMNYFPIYGPLELKMCIYKFMDISCSPPTFPLPFQDIKIQQVLKFLYCSFFLSVLFQFSQVMGFHWTGVSDEYSLFRSRKHRIRPAVRISCGIFGTSAKNQKLKKYCSRCFCYDTSILILLRSSSYLYTCF